MPEDRRLWRLHKTGRMTSVEFFGPDDLWERCCNYFEWATDNPILEHKPYVSNGEDVNLQIEHPQVFTKEGLRSYLGISKNRYKELKEDPEYADVIERVETQIYVNKFNGAAANVMNPMIISRELGLRDKLEHTGADGGPIETKELTDDEMARMLITLMPHGDESVIEHDSKGLLENSPSPTAQSIKQE